MRPTVSVTKVSSTLNLQENLKSFSDQELFIGIPPGTTSLDRQRQIFKMTAKTKNAGEQQRLSKASAHTAAHNLNNAELLYIFSKGSPLNGIPARPVIEAALSAPGNKDIMSYELKEYSRAKLAGDNRKAYFHLRRAGIAGKNFSQQWFFDPRNNWPPNTAGTIKFKGFDAPGVNTGAMREAITYIIKG